MKKISENFEYVPSNSVEPQKEYRISFPNGSVIYGKVIEVSYGDYDCCMNYVVLTTKEVAICKTYIRSITVDTGSPIGVVVVKVENPEQIQFDLEQGFEDYHVEYNEIEDIIKEHYAKKGLRVSMIDFDTDDVYITFEK